MPVPRVQDGLPNSDFYLLAGPDDGLEDLSLLSPLDPELVAAELAELGFVDGHGRPPAARQLPRIDLELVRDGHPRLALSTATYKRTLRLLDVEALDDLTTPSRPRDRAAVRRPRPPPQRPTPHRRREPRRRRLADAVQGAPTHSGEQHPVVEGYKQVDASDEERCTSPRGQQQAPLALRRAGPHALVAVAAAGWLARPQPQGLR